MSSKLIETIKSFGRESLAKLDESHGQRYNGSHQSMRKARLVKRKNKLAQEEDKTNIHKGANQELNMDPSLDTIDQTR
jgi:hypothetical protein